MKQDEMFRIKDLDLCRNDYKSLNQFLSSKLGCSKGCFNIEDSVECLLNHYNTSIKINKSRKAKLLYFASIIENATIFKYKQKNTKLSVKERIDNYFKLEKNKQ